MSVQSPPTRRLDAAIGWTGAGVVTSLATLALMLGVAMIGLGASDPDPTEGVFGYVLGAVGLGVWVVLVIVAGRILRRASTRRRGWLGILPTLVSAAWCGLASVMLTTALDLTNSLFSLVSSWIPPVWTLLVISITTAGTIPIAFALLIANIALRLVRQRHAAPIHRA